MSGSITTGMKKLDTLLGDHAYEQVLKQVEFVVNRSATHKVSQAWTARVRQSLRLNLQSQHKSLSPASVNRTAEGRLIEQIAGLGPLHDASRFELNHEPATARLVGTVTLVPDGKAPVGEFKLPAGHQRITITAAAGARFAPERGDVVTFTGIQGHYGMAGPFTPLVGPGERAYSVTTKLATPPTGPAAVQLFKPRRVLGGNAFLGAYSTLIAAFGHEAAKPPGLVCCGEMALMAYRVIVKSALERRIRMGAAAVSIDNGNHSFVLLGDSDTFLKWLEPKPVHRPGGHTDLEGPAKLVVPVDRLPPEFVGAVSICDPWINGGNMPSFRLGEPGGSAGSVKWVDYLKAVAEQAGKAGVGDMKAVIEALAARSTITLTIDDSIVIHPHQPAS